MADEAERKVPAVGAPAAEGTAGEALPAGASEASLLGTPKRPYLPPRLTSLGKVAELTSGNHGSAHDGGILPSKKG